MVNDLKNTYVQERQENEKTEYQSAFMKTSMFNGNIRLIEFREKDTTKGRFIIALHYSELSGLFYDTPLKNEFPYTTEAERIVAHDKAYSAYEKTNVCPYAIQTMIIEQPLLLAALGISLMTFFMLLF